MLPALEEPLVAGAFWVQSVAAGVALVRTQAATTPTSRAEAVVGLVVAALVTSIDAAVYWKCARTEREEARRSVRRRELRVDRSARIISSMLFVAAVWSLAFYVVAVAWPSNTDALVQAHTVAAAFGALLLALYFASTVEYSLLPRRPED